jgi:hypothetical protein
MKDDSDEAAYFVIAATAFGSMLLSPKPKGAFAIEAERAVA